jgi:hypothetical protein
MVLSINLTKRTRRRKLKSGETIEQTRYVLNWRDPRTGSREQRFFERQKEAQEKRAELIAAYDRGSYSANRKSLTVAEAVSAWLEAKRPSVPTHSPTTSSRRAISSARFCRQRPAPRPSARARAQSPTPSRSSCSGT